MSRSIDEYERISLTAARKNLAGVWSRLETQTTPIILTRHRKDIVVLISPEQFRNLVDGRCARSGGRLQSGVLKQRQISVSRLRRLLAGLRRRHLECWYIVAVWGRPHGVIVRLQDLAVGTSSEP